MTSLETLVLEGPLSDTHEHLFKEEDYVSQGPDLLQSLFGHYVKDDLISAGASEEALARLLDAREPDLASRFLGVRAAWEATRHTGYAEATRWMAREIYGMEEIVPEALPAAALRHAALRRPGERLRLLRDVARLDHVQVDDFVWACRPDLSGPGFFFYDLNWASCCSQHPEFFSFEKLAEETGVDAGSLPALRRALEALFEKYAPFAIAVKAQHAYTRTLAWRERTDGEAERALAAIRADPAHGRMEDRLALGDWCWERGVELAALHDLPFKIHTGYYADNKPMPVEYIRPGHLWELIARHPRTRFVLMHIGFPYENELLSIVKHYPNGYADLCWAWSICPPASLDFLRRAIHAVPANKVFAFGGDVRWPAPAAAYARQARTGLLQALKAEIAEGLLDEREALALARRLMMENAYACFRVEARRAALTKAAEAAMGKTAAGA